MIFFELKESDYNFEEKKRRKRMKTNLYIFTQNCFSIKNTYFLGFGHKTQYFWVSTQTNLILGDKNKGGFGKQVINDIINKL